MIKISGLEYLTASERSEVFGGLLDVSEGRLRRHSIKSTRRCPVKYSMPAGLGYEELGGLSDPGQWDCCIENSRVRDNSWMYLTSLVTTRIGIELATVQRKLPDYVAVGLQLYSVRTFHVTMSPQISLQEMW